MSRAKQLLQLFKDASDATLSLKEITDRLGVDRKQARNAIDAARDSGACIVSLGRGTEKWKIGYCLSHSNRRWPA
jgi:biotin operon repressor